MKKCKGCDKEIDKYAIACQYCGKLPHEHEDDSKHDQDKDQAAKKIGDGFEDGTAEA